MSGMIRMEDLQDRIIDIRGEMVLLDSDVAELYDVETKRINEAVKNNPDKFPAGYIVELEKREWNLLKSKFSTSAKGGKAHENKSVPVFYSESLRWLAKTSTDYAD